MKDSKYQWVRNRSNISRRHKLAFSKLCHSSWKTSHTSETKEFESQGWDHHNRTRAVKGWQLLRGWMSRHRLKPVKRAGETLRKHLCGIINTVILGAEKSHAECMNSQMEKAKARERDFRKKQRVYSAMYPHVRGMKLCSAEFGANVPTMVGE